MIGGVPATDIAVESATSIAAKTGAHPTGASDVMVTVAGRNGTLPGAFTYDTGHRARHHVSHRAGNPHERAQELRRPRRGGLCDRRRPGS